MKTQIKYFTNYTLILTLFLFISSKGYAQDQADEEIRNQHSEVIDDPYIPVDKTTMQRSPAYRIARRSEFITVQVNTDAAGMNIVGDAANEPSLAVDPTAPNRMVMGWRQFDDISSNFRQAGYGYSLDGGDTWTFPGVLDPGNFRSDPVLDFDAEGNFYYNSLQSGFMCDVYKIEDDGIDFGEPNPARGGDKQWMRLDRTTGIGVRNNYSYWNESFTTCEGAFTRSTDGSETFDECISVEGMPFWGTLAVDADGVLYIVGRSGSEMIVTKSTSARDASLEVTWDTINIVDLDGIVSAQPEVNPQGLLGQAWIDVDISDTANRGNVYVLASVPRDSNSDPGDVMFAKSTDGGITFTEPIRINTDASTTNIQWFSTMAVAPNGRIDAIWLDTRVNTGFDSALFYSFSEDAGETWSPNEQISEAFDPTIGYPQQDKMGDYFDMVSDNDFAHIAWANTLNGGQDVYYTRISPKAVLGIADFTLLNSGTLKVYPNPVTENSVISFSLLSEENVTITIYDILGRKVKTLFDEKASGNQIISWDLLSDANTRLSAGLYFIFLTTPSFEENVKIIVD